MRINKELQYALLITLYLCRSGRATGHSMAEGLDLSEDLVQQVARKLRQYKVIKSIRGPGGGFELSGDPTVKEVFDAIQPLAFISPKDRYDLWDGRSEDRSLKNLVSSLTAALTPIMSRKVRNVGMDIVANDTARLNRPSPSLKEN